MPEQDFLYDDFFSPEDAAPIPTTIEVRGRSLIIGLRPLSFADLRAIMKKSVKVSIGPDGKPKLDLTDEDAGNNALILASLKSWPFKDHDGSMVPINEKTLGEMHADVLTAILEAVTRFTQATTQAAQGQINGPFVKPSVVGS